MKIVITGANGQLGHDVVNQLADGNFEVFPLVRATVELTNRQAVLSYMENIQPDVIIHCAAYTNVDGAEGDRKTAYEVNGLATQYLAEAAERLDAKMVYVSTDYVFDGTANTPYEVNHPTAPLGVYGDTKLSGEEFVQHHAKKHFIVRTAWVFGVNGNNFVKTMMKLGRERGEVGVVHDQVGSPTYTVDLASFIIELMQSEKYGIYHATNEGVCSWYEFAQEIFRQTGMKVNIKPLTTEEFPRPAARPKYSVLSKAKITEQGFQPMRNWKESLMAYLQEA